MGADDLWVLPKPLARHPFISGRTHRSSGCCYNIVSEDNLRMAAQKTTMYVDTLPTRSVANINTLRRRSPHSWPPSP